MKEIQSQLFNMESFHEQEGPEKTKKRMLLAVVTPTLSPLRSMVAEQIADPLKIRPFAKVLDRLKMRVRDTKTGRGKTSFFIERCK
jgi:hypothetical protein